MVCSIHHLYNKFQNYPYIKFEKHVELNGKMWYEINQKVLMAKIIIELGWREFKFN